MGLVRSILVSSVLLSSVLQALTLKEALNQARKNARELREVDHDIAISEYQKFALDQAFDSNFESSLSQLMDQTASQGIGKDRLDNSHYQVNYQKMFSTGTRVKASLSIDKNKLTFPSIQPEQATAFNPASLYQINPEYVSKVQLELVQPLWRNAGANEIKLQRKVIEGGVLQPSYRRLLLEQNLQGEVESYYLSLAAINAKLQLMTRMESLAKLYYSLAQKRLRQGRLSSIDVARAFDRVLGVSKQSLELNILRKQHEIRLYHRIYPAEANRPQPNYVFPSLNDPRGNISELQGTQNSAFGRVLPKRIDLEQLRALEQPIQSELTLIREQRKTSIDAFLTVGSNGLKDGFSESISEMTQFSNPFASIGVRFKMDLGQTGLKSKQFELSEKLSKLRTQRVLLEDQIRRDITLVFHDRESALQRTKKAFEQIYSLRKQLSLEEEKIKQARSDRFIITRYKMDILNAEIQKIDAKVSERLAEAKYSLISHSYERKKL